VQVVILLSFGLDKKKKSEYSQAHWGPPPNTEQFMPLPFERETAL
jgi:hypothetical protein